MRCLYCNKWHDPGRAIGWDNRYCQPLCEKRNIAELGEKFSRWWEKDKQKWS